MRVADPGPVLQKLLFTTAEATIISGNLGTGPPNAQARAPSTPDTPCRTRPCCTSLRSTRAGWPGCTGSRTDPLFRGSSSSGPWGAGWGRPPCLHLWCRARVRPRSPRPAASAWSECLDLALKFVGQIFKVSVGFRSHLQNLMSKFLG